MERTYLIFGIFITVINGTFGCRPEEEFLECLDQFNEWENGNDFWADMCSENLNGGYIFKCLNDERQCESKRHNLTDFDVFQNIFGPDYSYNETCEVETNDVCRDKSCFNAINTFHNDEDPIAGMTEYFCGPNYMMGTFACVGNVEKECPLTFAAYRDSFELRTSNATIPYTVLRNKTVEECGKVSSTDMNCIINYATELESCGVAPIINTTSSTITCDYTDRTKECMSKVCGKAVAAFYINMFTFLRCGKTNTACESDEEDDIIWPVTRVGDTLVYGCDPAFFQGTIRRQCGSGGAWGDVIFNCTLKPDILEDLLTTINNVLNSQKNTTDIVESVLQTTANLTGSKAFVPTEDNVEDITKVQKSTVDVLETTKNVTDKETELFLETASNTLAPKTKEIWDDINQDKEEISAGTVLNNVDSFISVLQDQACSTFDIGQEKTTENKHIHVQVGKRTTAVNLVYPDGKQTSTTLDISRSQIMVPAASFQNIGLTEVCFGGAYFTTIADHLEESWVVNRSATVFENGQQVNSVVISLQLNLTSELTDKEFDPPISITHKVTKPGLTKPVCVFWDFSVIDDGVNGAWSTDGCSLVSENEQTVVCSCNHLTNFAVLMSTATISPADAEALSIISAVGCGISMLGLLLTVIIHGVVWRLVRSDRAVLLMNLCVALLVALGLFLVGINRVESRAACSAIAALIQYLFLVVFALMLLMGIEILICVVHVFGTKFRIKVLLPVAWFLPAVIVGISMGVTQMEGYGNDKFCWLDVGSGLIWAFIGPVAFVIFANLIIITIVFYKMCSSTIVKSKTTKIRVLTGLRSLCILLPLMGVTWVFGILSVNEDVRVFPYIFCIVNSLQGFFIFLLHCVFNRQVREALKKRQARKRSLATFSTNFRKQSQSASMDRQNSDSYKSEDMMNTTLPKSRHGGLATSSKGDNWERQERKKYHKNIRKGLSS